MSANFIKLDSTERLEELFEQSHEKPVLLFKHSTTCPISTGVYQEVSRVNGDINLIVMQSARDISNAVAEKNRHSPRIAASNRSQKRRARLSRFAFRRDGGRY
jgi:bacillithiol system protein YtxJ